VPRKDHDKDRQYRLEHKDEYNANRNAAHALNPSKYKKAPAAYFRWHHINKKYGLSQIQWRALLERQGFRCACCGGMEPGKRGWHTDHDPATGVVRGILCRSCNMGLGHFSHKYELLLIAARYIKRHARSVQK
jgi:hypothetical protein